MHKGTELEKDSLAGLKVLVSLHYDRTMFYPMKNIKGISELPVRSCENRQFPL